MCASNTICRQKPGNGQITVSRESDVNNIYAISANNSVPFADAVKSLEGISEPKRFVDVRPGDLQTFPRRKRIENRCHRRFQLKGIAFAMIRSIAAEPLQIDGMSMGGIGCAVYNSKPVRLGKIDNISMGGLMFLHVGHKPRSSMMPVVDILLAECGVCLADLPYKTITDVAIPGDDPGDPVEMWQVRLQFQKLNPQQSFSLKAFILSHGAENGVVGISD